MLVDIFLVMKYFFECIIIPILPAGLLETGGGNKNIMQYLFYSLILFGFVLESINHACYILKVHTIHRKILHKFATGFQLLLSKAYRTELVNCFV